MSSSLIGYSEAIEFIENNILKLEHEIVSCGEMLNRVCAENVHAPFSMPRFNNSAMDGFALDWELTVDCSKNNLKKFKVKNSIAAGDVVENNYSKIELIAVEIMTGAPVPNSFNSVIPVEDVTIIPDSKGTFIVINKKMNESDNIRYKGEDFLEGQVIINENELITHEKIMLLSAFGINKVVVKKKMKIAILATGKELVDNETNELKEQEIYNSNTPYLNSILSDYPVETQIFKTVPDDKNLFMQSVLEIKKQGFHLIISTGAVSKGKWDIIPECLKELEANILFHRVRIKPGKPILFAQMHQSLFYFGLPGNPISTAVGFRFFISPFIRRSLGLIKEKMMPLKLETEGKKKLGMTFFQKGNISVDEFSTVRGVILSGQESFKMKSFSKSNGWIILPESMECYKTNDTAFFLPLEINSKLFL